MESYNLSRFVDAQVQYSFQAILSELTNGKKTGHWMWFVFPQLKGLGRSDKSEYFGISDIEEAQAYLSHEVLGQRLVESTEAVLTKPELKAKKIFGSPDYLKFNSSLTLFNQVSVEENIFGTALQHYFKGKQCKKTLALLNG